MSATTNTQTKPPIHPAPSDNGMTEKNLDEILAYIAAQKYDAGYFERWREQVAEYRRQVAEETNRLLDDAEGK